MTTTAPAAGTSAHEVAPQETRRRDVRYLALRNFALSLTAFNILGYTVLGFEQPWLWPLLAVGTGFATELGLEALGAWSERRRAAFVGAAPRQLLTFLLPAYITSLAVNMLLYANDQWWPIMFAVVVAVAQKHLLRAPINGRWRHFMNPSNFGITVTLLMFSSWVSIAPPYEFTEYANGLFRILIPLVVGTAGTIINATLTGKVPLITGWMGGFFLQALLRHWVWHAPLFSAIGVMTGVAFVLFTNYMITDPGTTPSKPRAQFVFGSCVAAAYAVLMLLNVTYTLFFAVTLVCGLRGLGWWAVHLRARLVVPSARQTAPEPS